MKAFVLLALAVTTAVALGGPASGATTRECDGFQVCIAVKGPWVVVPTHGGASRPQVSYQLTCPRRYVVGGLDAEVSERAVDVSFEGSLGSPVTPGVTTTNTALFHAAYVGVAAAATAFRPHIGCIPAAGSGNRVPTSLTIARAGRLTTARSKTARLHPGSTRIAVACKAGEHVVGAWHAFGFIRRNPPDAGLAGTISGTRAVSGRRVVATVHADAELAGVKAVAQVGAVCAGAR